MLHLICFAMVLRWQCLLCSQGGQDSRWPQLGRAFSLHHSSRASFWHLKLIFQRRSSRFPASGWNDGRENASAGLAMLSWVVGERYLFPVGCKHNMQTLCNDRDCFLVQVINVPCTVFACIYMYLVISGVVLCFCGFDSLTQTSLLTLAEGPGREGFTKELEDKFHRWSPDRTQTQDRNRPKTSEDWIKTMTFHDSKKMEKSDLQNLCLSRVSWNTWTLRDNWAASSTAFLSRFHENTTCKKLDTRLDRQAWHNGADVLKVVLRLCSQPVHTKKPSVFPVFRVWQCDTKALVISVLTTVDMLYGANDLSRAQPCQVEYRTFRTWRCSHCYGWVEYRTRSGTW